MSPSGLGAGPRRAAPPARPSDPRSTALIRSSGRPRKPGWLVVLILLAIAVPGVVVGMTGSASVQFGREGERPNIVVIQTDDQTVEQMAVLQNVEELVGRRGATYTQYLTSFPLCCPSRASLLTGMYAHNTGVEGNGPPHGGYGRLRQGETLPVWLSRAGYHTGHFGKFLNGYGGSTPREVPLGWAEWVTAPHPFQHMYTGYELNVNGRIVAHGHAESDHADDVTTEGAVDFVRRRAAEDAPFFLAVDYLAPHQGSPPLDVRCGRSSRPAPRHAGRFADVPLPAPPSLNELDVSDKPAPVRERPLLTPHQLEVVTEAYQCRRESLLAVDEGVKRIVDTLEATGALDRTYVLFLSDNGYFSGEHRLASGKRRAYDVATRVPFLIRGPGIAAGRVLDNPVANIDIAPTLLDAAGATGAVPERFLLDGRSLLPQLRGDDDADGAGGPAGAERAVLLEIPKGAGYAPGYFGVRTQRYTYVEYLSGERELYDRLLDPFELESRHADVAYDGVRAALEPVLAALRTCAGRACDQSVRPPEPGLPPLGQP